MKRKTSKLMPSDVADAKRVTVTEDDLLARVTAHGLNVKGVTRAEAGNVTVLWRKHPTEAEMAFAQELIGERTGHAT